MKQEFHKILRKDINAYSDYRVRIQVATEFINAGKIARLKEIYSLGSIDNSDERRDAILAFVSNGAIELVLETYSQEEVRTILLNGSSLEEVSKSIHICILRDNLKGLQFIVANSGFDVSTCPMLLSLACIRGKFPIIKFLLDSGIDANAADNFGYSPIEIAVLFNNYVALSALDRVRAKSECDEIANSSRNRAIRMSVILELVDEGIAKSSVSPYKYFKKEYEDWLEKDPTIIALFRSFEALNGIKLKQKRKTLRESLNGIKNNYLENFPTLQNLTPSMQDDILLRRKCMIARHVKELSEEDKRALLLREKDLLEEAEFCVPELLIIYLTTQYTNVNALIRYANKLYREAGKKPEISYCIVEIYIKIFGKREELKELFSAANALLKSTKFCDDTLTGYIDLYIHFNSFHPPEKLVKYLSALLKRMNTNKDTLRNYTNYIEYIHKQLGELYRKLADLHEDSSEKAIEYYSTAFKFDRKDDLILILYADTLVRLERYSELSEVCDQAQCSDSLKQLVITELQIVTGKISFEEGEDRASRIEMNDVERKFWVQFSYRNCMKLHNHRKATPYIYELVSLFDRYSLNSINQKCELDRHLTNLLLCHVHNKEPEKVLNFAFKDRFSDEMVWVETAFVVYLRINAHLQLNQLEEAVELFKQLNSRKAVNPSSIIELHMTNSIWFGNNDDLLRSVQFFSEIKEYIENLDIKNKVELYEQHIILLLPEATRASFPKPTAIQDCFLKDDVVAEVSEDSEEEKDWNWEDYDPKKVHKFFQDKKVSYIDKPIAHKRIWIVNGIEYSEERGNIYEVDPVFFPKHRAAIDANLQVLSIFLTAISKGLCRHAFGNNGDKELSNGMFELKANCDSRLLARTLYENGAGEVLILFNEVKDHAEIRKICRSQKVLLQNTQNGSMSQSL